MTKLPRALIVEGMPLYREGLMRLLIKGLRVEIVASAGTLADGLYYLEAYQPDLAIIDCDTPDGDILEVLDLARRSSPATALVLTSIGFSEEDETIARRAGVCACLVKSADSGDIAKVLLAALNSQRSARQPHPPARDTHRPPAGHG